MLEVVQRGGDALTTAELYGLLRLRVDVFVVEQQCPYPELDGTDLLSSTRHLWARWNGEVIGCARTSAEADGARRIGRVCTRSGARGAGVASALLRAVLDLAPQVEHVLDSQTYAQGFYARFGFVAEGESFHEDGISHITMRRQAVRREDV